MKHASTLANSLWMARSYPAYLRFGRALRDPKRVQEQWLITQLRAHASSCIGSTMDFGSIESVVQYRRQVPLTDYAGIEQSVMRVRRGESNVLACGRVSHLAPTSGSTGARKLIPFTAGLQAAFDAAVGPWMIDLARQRPRLLGGPAYWAISPLADDDAEDRAPSAQPPVGFADDAEYLGGAASWLVRQVMAVPSSVRHVRETSAFWMLSLLALLRQRDLRLISVWHPSYLDLMLQAAELHWPALLEAIATGECDWVTALPADTRAVWLRTADPGRSRELQHVGPGDWTRWWERLQVVSCWGEQAAESGWRALTQRLPGVLVQAKGLLATEGVVTIPFAGTHLLAVTSHFFEFLDAAGSARGAHELERGAHYEVVLTNGGGLWRYRLGDLVECTGHVAATPSLRFLGRLGHVSDLRGEKLSEPFVAEVLRSLWPEVFRPRYAALRAHSSPEGAGYELLVSVDGDDQSAEILCARLEDALGANPHYALARRLGQLQRVRVVFVPAESELAVLSGLRGRLGGAKPQVLLGVSGANP